MYYWTKEELERQFGSLNILQSNNTNIETSELERYKKIEKRINRHMETIKEYESRKDSLLAHGYWSLGYYTGIVNELERILDSELEIYRKNIERRIKRHKETIKDYENRENALSVHGYWTLGYYTGIVNELERILDDIDDFIEEQETTK